jgi:cellulose synthase/poly-beta-1,6-N-acetylglucosamine synthase-like glycosyltransferase
MELIIASYCVLLIVSLCIYFAIPKSTDRGNEAFFSIIVPVRNEAENILTLLNSIKSIDYKNFELIIVNDNSTDNTLAILKDYNKNWPFTIIDLKETNSSPKKNAINKAMEIAEGDYIFCTDGDCILPPNILSNYASYFETKSAQFLTGPVTFISKKDSILKNIWTQFQTVEFASLTAIAAVSMHLQKPNMCSGANLAFKKETFFALHGYEGNLHLASGDDEFLMHKFSKAFPDNVFYIKNQGCIVETQATENISTFLEQRKRWASKWKSYDSIQPTILAVFIFFVNLFTIFLELNLEFKYIIIRYLCEFVLLSSVLVFFKKYGSIWCIIPVQFFYKYYVVYTAIMVLFKTETYNWKGRNLK